jgi:hypothetical protein
LVISGAAELYAQDKRGTTVENRRLPLIDPSSWFPPAQQDAWKMPSNRGRTFSIALEAPAVPPVVASFVVVLSCVVLALVSAPRESAARAIEVASID